MPVSLLNKRHGLGSSAPTLVQKTRRLAILNALSDFFADVEILWIGGAYRAKQIANASLDGIAGIQKMVITAAEHLYSKTHSNFARRIEILARVYQIFQHPELAWSIFSAPSKSVSKPKAATILSWHAITAELRPRRQRSTYPTRYRSR